VLIKIGGKYKKSGKDAELLVNPKINSPGIQQLLDGIMIRFARRYDDVIKKRF